MLEPFWFTCCSGHWSGPAALTVPRSALGLFAEKWDVLFCFVSGAWKCWNIMLWTFWCLCIHMKMQLPWNFASWCLYAYFWVYFRIISSSLAQANVSPEMLKMFCEWAQGTDFLAGLARLLQSKVVLEDNDFGLLLKSLQVSKLLHVV